MNKNDKIKRAMRQKEAARGKSTSIRFSDNDREIITEKATAKGMSFSEYVRDSSVHRDDGCFPYTKNKIQNVFNEVCEELKELNSKKLDKIEKEMKDVWTM